MEVCPYRYFQWCGCLRGPWVSFVMTDELAMRVTKSYFRYWCLMNSQSTFLFLTYFDSMKWSYYQKHVNHNCEPHKSVKLGLTNTQGLCSNFVECESFLKSNSPDILVLCKKKLGWLNWFWKFLFEGEERILLLKCTVWQFMWKKDFHLHRTHL